MSNPSFLDAIRMVKENERIASESYADAANKTSDQIGKKLFEMLSEFEKVHYAQLSDLEKSLDKTGDFANPEGQEFPLPPTLNIEGAGELHQQSLIGVLTAAMNLEQRAEKAYAYLAALVTDQQGREIFGKLSEQEHTHYLLLRDAYWIQSRANSRR